MRRQIRSHGQVNLVPNYIVLILLALFTLGPLLMLGFNWFKTNLEIGGNPIALPSSLQLQNYSEAWVQGDFARTMRNSLVLVVGSVAGVLVLGGMAAYSLARLDPPGANGYMVYMLTLSTLPFWMYVIPLFILWRNLHLIDSYLGLILIYVAGNSPFAIFLLRSYMVQFPRDFEDAARVDGANELQLLTRVVLPLMWPGFLTVGLVVALSVWSEFQVALVFIQDDSMLPVTRSYFAFMRRFSRDWALTSAGAVMMITPVLVIFLALQRRFIDGLTQGGVKM